MSEKPPYSPAMALLQAQRGHQKDRDDGAAKVPGRILPEIHASVAEKDGRGHSKPGDFFEEGQLVVCSLGLKYVCCDTSPANFLIHFVQIFGCLKWQNFHYSYLVWNRFELGWVELWKEWYT